jgi:serine/threonine protein kinase
MKHRDPAIAPPLATVVIDFGMVRAITGPPEVAGRFVAGTAGYIAPEQVLDPVELDPRADVYALAGTIYNVTTGRSFFDEIENTRDRIIAHMRATPSRTRSACVREVEAREVMDEDVVARRELGHLPDLGREVGFAHAHPSGLERSDLRAGDADGRQRAQARDHLDDPLCLRGARRAREEVPLDRVQLRRLDVIGEVVDEQLEREVLACGCAHGPSRWPSRQSRSWANARWRRTRTLPAVVCSAPAISWAVLSR